MKVGEERVWKKGGYESYSLIFCAFVRICAPVCVCVRACVRACVRVCLCACVRGIFSSIMFSLCIIFELLCILDMIL